MISMKNFLIIVLLMYAVSFSTTATPILSFNPVGSDDLIIVNQGETTKLDIWINYLDLGAIGGFQFDVTFNENLFNFNSLTYSPYIDTPDWYLDHYINGSNIEMFGLYFSINEHLKSFKIATIDFTAVGEGFGDFGFKNIIVSDLWASKLITSSTIRTAKIEVPVTVPEPNSLYLFVFALTLLLYNKGFNRPTLSFYRKKTYY